MMNRSSEQSGDGSLVAAAGVVVLQNLSQSSPLQQQQHQYQQHHDHNYDAVAAPTSSIIAPPPTTLPPRRVDHTYRDFSNFPIDELPAARGKRTPTNFPSKLHQILSNPEYAHIISWMPHGRAWKIHNKELLVQDIVPKYFVQSKYESFTRQLNGWGFKRLHQSGNDFNAFYHECFLKGMPHLTVLMQRVPPNQGKLLPHVEGEPNFYEIDQQFPLPSRPKNNEVINLNANTMMSSSMIPSAYGGAAPGGGGGAYYGASGYGYGACSTPLLPYYHPQQHHPSNNSFSSFYSSGTMMSYPPATQGDYQQGRIGVVGQPPFSSPNIVGHHDHHSSSSGITGGGLLLPPPAQSYHPNPFNGTRPSSFVQDTLCFVGDHESLGAAGNAMTGGARSDSEE